MDIHIHDTQKIDLGEVKTHTTGGRVFYSRTIEVESRYQKDTKQKDTIVLFSDEKGSLMVGW